MPRERDSTAGGDQMIRGGKEDRDAGVRVKFDKI